jgi:hypothetical protein
MGAATNSDRVRKQRTMLGAPTGEQREASPDDDLFVPVTNANYVPSGGGELQGFVPDHPGDDRTLLRQKESLEAQGLPSGEDVEPIEEDQVNEFLGIPPADSHDPIDPDPPDPEAPIDQSGDDPITDNPPPDVDYSEPEAVAPTETESPVQRDDKPLF